jgi:hypothetical protein
MKLVKCCMWHDTGSVNDDDARHRHEVSTDTRSFVSRHSFFSAQQQYSNNYVIELRFSQSLCLSVYGLSPCALIFHENGMTRHDTTFIVIITGIIVMFSNFLIFLPCCINWQKRSANQSNDWTTTIDCWTDAYSMYRNEMVPLSQVTLLMMSIARVNRELFVSVPWSTMLLTNNCKTDFSIDSMMCIQFDTCSSCVWRFDGAVQADRTMSTRE